MTLTTIETARSEPTTSPDGPATSWEERARQFRREVIQLGAEARRAAGDADVSHLRRRERWGRINDLAGLVLALRKPSVVAATLLAQGSNTRWMLQHHISHGAYDQLPTAPARYHSDVFARGRRRIIDWLDWIEPEAWHEEHDLAHHHRLGEDEDPDLIERNFAWLRQKRRARWLAPAVIGAFSGIWRLVYYAPTTLKVRMEAEARRDGTEPPSGSAIDPRQAYGRRFWRSCVAPKLFGRFVLPTALALLLGRRRAAALLINLVMAEVLENIQAFAVITPGHTGSDLYRFDRPAREPGEHQLRQVIGTTNFTIGGDLNDQLHMWLNYQIEPHLWPDLTLLQYRRVAPELQALCERHGIPYRCESLPRRFRRMFRVAAGAESMLWAPPYPGQAGHSEKS